MTKTTTLWKSPIHHCNKSNISRRSNNNRNNLVSLVACSVFALQVLTVNSTAFAYSSMSTHTTERDGKGTIVVSPKDESSQSALIVICHGLGDSAEGFADVAEQFATQLPYAKFVLPTAPTQPVTMNMGMPMPSWYDIKGLDERANESCKGIVESRDRIVKILEDEHKATGLPFSRMLLAGFSQGGALSLWTGLQLPVEQKPAGIVVMSGYLAAAAQFKLTPELKDVPIFHGHGQMDPMVQYPMAQKTQSRLMEAGVLNYELKTYPIQHTVSPSEIGDVLKFIQKVLPPDDTCKIKVKDPSEMSVKELKAAIRKSGLASKAVGFMEKREFVKLLQDHRDGKL